VQLAFPKCIFILDGVNRKSKQLRPALLDYIASGKPIVGHAIGNDLDAMLLSFGIN
jgi:hypothetical protein